MNSSRSVLQIFRPLLRHVDYFIGVDVNSSTTGIAAMNAKGNSLQLRDNFVGVVTSFEIVDTEKATDSFGWCSLGSPYKPESAALFEDSLTSFTKKLPSTSTKFAVVEMYLKSFASGRFGTNVLFSLAECNTLYTAACKKIIGPTMRVNVSLARALHGIHGKKSADVKKAVFDSMIQRFQGERKS
jgi:hypothetical protein